MDAHDIGSLESSISQYKLQLSQVDLAIASAVGSEHESLSLLRSEIEKLINLTQETLDSVQKQGKTGSEDSEDPLADEYALFKAELAAADTEVQTPDTAVENSGSIEDDLKSLNGMKCQAPHTHHWGETSYHNALVCGAESTEEVATLEDIRVRVLFINPTHREMLPCPYFLEGECRFSDEKCYFSHGELVKLSALKEYREPDFSVVQPGRGILAKSSDNLWHRARVLSAPENNKCTVKYESSGKKCDVDLHDTFPLEDVNNDEQEEGHDEESSENSDNENVDQSIHEFLVQKSLMQSPTNAAIGSWEKYTKGFGSRVMAQMGYVIGTGLGKYGEGRIEPVEAVVLPAGKSLDHCMELKEQAGGDENLFKVEKRLKRLQKKEEQKQKQLAEREKNNTNIFDFINCKLGGKKGDLNDLKTQKYESQEKADTSSKNLQTKSNKNLNVFSFQVDQEIKRTEVEVIRLQDSLIRQTEGGSSHKRIMDQIKEKQDVLRQLRLSENSINLENKRRKDHKKLTIF